MVVGEEELHFWLGWLLYFPTILMSLYVFCMSLKEVEEIPGRSLEEFIHIVSSSTTLMRLYTGNQLSNLSRSIPSLPCHLCVTYGSLEDIPDSWEKSR
jgi:hypothetical protein